MSRLSNLPPGVTERMIPGVTDDDENDPSLACDRCGDHCENGEGHYSDGDQGDRLCADCYATELLDSEGQ